MLTRTLAQTRAVAADVRRAAEDLAVVNTVLEQELPKDVQVGDVALAITHTSDLEKRLVESAKTLAEVREALDVEVSRRVAVTRQRDESEAKLEALSKKDD